MATAFPQEMTSINISSNTTAESPTIPPSMPSVFEAIIMYIICLGAIFSNMMVFFTLPHLKGKIRTQTRYCMISLVITDSVFGVGSFVSKTIFLTNIGIYEDYLCFFEGIAASYVLQMTIVGLTLLNTDRILVVMLPGRYDIWMTGKKFVIILMSLWIAFTVRYILAGILFTERYYLKGAYICLIKYNAHKIFAATAMMVILVVPFLNCVASFITFFRIVKRRAMLHVENAQHSKSRDSIAVLSAVFLLTTAYFFMTAPFCVCVLMWDVLFDTTISPATNFVTTWLLACNSVVNPFIYLATMKSYRQEFHKRVTKLFRRKIEQLPQNLDDSRFSTHAYTSTQL